MCRLSSVTPVAAPVLGFVSVGLASAAAGQASAALARWRRDGRAFDTARWISGPDAAMSAFTGFNRANLAKDRDGHAVFMARSAWDVGYQQEKNPELVFSATKER